MRKPLCFVLMPFGRKPDAGGHLIHFDAVYQDLIAPAIVAAGLDPLRADEEQVGGIIHKAMFERLILCEFAVADLTTANANVFYELGVRHAIRQASTVLLFAENSRLPFDVNLLRAIPYSIGLGGAPDQVENAKHNLTQRLLAAKESRAKDSPIFELVEGFPDIQRLKTDVFRDRIEYRASVKERLTTARGQGVEAIQSVEKEFGQISDQDAGVCIDLFLSYRAVKAWDLMIALKEKMSKPLRETVMVQEQFALALNRNGQGERAERVLKELLERRGPSSETYGILGRVYKDRWEAATKAGSDKLARGLLDQAIEAYVRGFEADWRDAYPGINAVTLMTLRKEPDPRCRRLIPVVAYSVERRIATGKPDYWDYATQLELAVLAKKRASANNAAGKALAAVRESWEPETTARNLRLIREAREKRGTAKPWMLELEQELLRKSA